MISLGKKQPQIPHDKLLRYADEAAEIAVDGTVGFDELCEKAEEVGVPVERLMAGMALAGDVQLERVTETRVSVCTGACQEAGSLALLQRLVEHRQDREDDGQPSFDLHAKTCLDRCKEACAVLIESPAGAATLVKTSADEVEEALAELLD